jgi:hypothetical protein
MKSKYLIISVLLSLTWQTIAQEINFYSDIINFSVKEKLGLSATDAITQEMTDTITELNLEGLGISDIRDLVYFPSLESLNLAYNGIRDISPLLVLRNLHYLNIQSNFLEAVDLLALSESLQMTVVLSANYIKDFYAITHSPQCLFNIIGMNLQYPYTYEVNNFYTDYDLTTSAGVVTSEFWSLHAFDDFFVENGVAKYPVLPDTLQQTSLNVKNNRIFLTTEEQTMDSTCFVPITILETNDTSLLFVIALPVKNYTILSVETFCSDAKIAGDSIILTRPDSITNDTVKIAFGYLYENGISRLKGYTYVIIKEREETGIKEEQIRPVVHIFPNPASKFVNVTSMDSEIRLIEIYSQTGQKVYTEKQHTGNVNISSLPAGVYIIRIHTDRGVTDKKLVKK